MMQEAGTDPILTPGPIGVAPAPGPLDGYAALTALRVGIWRVIDFREIQSTQ